MGARFVVRNIQQQQPPYCTTSPRHATTPLPPIARLNGSKATASSPHANADLDVAVEIAPVDTVGRCADGQQAAPVRIARLGWDRHRGVSVVHKRRRVHKGRRVVAGALARQSNRGHGGWGVVGAVNVDRNGSYRGVGRDFQRKIFKKVDDRQ